MSAADSNPCGLSAPMPDSHALPAPPPPWKLRLYVAAGHARSRQAIANLARLRAAHLPPGTEVEVVDIRAAAADALAHGITSAPTLLRLSPPPLRQVPGDLSDTHALLRRLDLEPGAPAPEPDQSAKATATPQPPDVLLLADPDGSPRLYAREATDAPFRQLVEQMQEGALTLTGSGEVLFANRRVANQLGLPPERLPGQDLAGYIAPRDAATWRRLLAQAAPTGARGELSLRRPDGTETPVFASLSPLAATEGPAVICGVFTDLTHHKLRLQAAEEANTLLRAVMAERERAEEALRQAQKMQAISQLSGGIAHDFNNMLQGFASGIELMRRRLEQNRAADALRYLDAVLHGVDRAASLTQRLLAFSRRQTLLPQPVDATSLLAGMADLVRRTVGQQVAVVLNLDPSCPPMRCDRAQLEAALINLATNARDAMVPMGGGTLTLATEAAELAAPQLVGFAAAKPGPYIRITVADTGVGMTQDVQARAFEPFFTTKPAGSGTGLGLSQVWGFAAQSGGLLRVTTAPGQGAIFHLYLPADRAAAHPGPAVPATLPAPARDTPATVLLVDDEPQVREALAEALADLGLEVRQASNGAEGLAMLGTGPAPDLLVADIGLPGGMNGRELAEAARALHPALPILFITGYAGSALGLGATLPAGAQLLHKPFTLGALASRVQALVPGRG